MYSQSDSGLVHKNTVETICFIYNTDLLKTLFHGAAQGYKYLESNGFFATTSFHPAI